nr:hypothetical 11.6 kDa protein y4eB [Bradyrhizobium sp. DOA9]
MNNRRAPSYGHHKRVSGLFDCRTGPHDKPHAEGRQSCPGRDHDPEPAGQVRAHHRRDQPLQRERPQPTHLCGPGRDWGSLVEARRDYLSLKLDDPSFNAPIYANLFDDEGGEGYNLLWSRPRENGE